MNNLNFLCDIVNNSQELDVDPQDFLQLVEHQVSKYMIREKYQGSMLYPPRKYYDKAVNVVRRYYKNE